MTSARNRYAVCQNVLRAGDLATNIAWAADAGAGAVALEAHDVLDFGVEKTRRLLEERRLGMSSLMRSIGSILPSDPDGAEPSEEKVAAMVDLCADLGAPGIGITTGPIGSLTRAEADDRCRAWVRRMAPLAVARDVQLILEPVHPLIQWASYVHSLRHAVDLTEGQAGTCVLLDVGHLFWDRNLPADLDSVGDQVGLVQVDDVDGDAAREFRYARVQLGQGILPLAELLAVIEASGYEGWYENEIGIRIPKEERVDFVREGGEWLARTLAAEGRGR